jgi:hypothetical protein
MEENKLPLAVRHADGTVTVDGEKQPFRQGMIRTFVMSVADLQYFRGYSITDGKSQLQARISGKGDIGDRDTIQVATLPDTRTTKIPFNVRAVAADSEHQWRLNIGYLAGDWEFTWEADFYFEAYVPQAAFDDLEAALLAGRVVKLNIMADTELWVRDYDWHAPPSSNVTWFLIPEEDAARASPQGANGKLTSFGWEEVPVSRVVPPAPVTQAAPVEQRRAHDDGAALAEEILRPHRSKAAAAAPEPKKRSWGLIAAWTVFILFCAAYALTRGSG